MKWQEVRKLFPNQFVLLSILEYREEGGKKIITDVAPVRSVSDEDANKEFFSAGPKQLVYHTSNEECIVHLRYDSLVRMSRNKKADTGLTPAPAYAALLTFEQCDREATQAAF